MAASITKPQQDHPKRLEHCNDPEPSTALHSAYGRPVLLKPGCKVFLSHSSQDTGFVQRLYTDLCSSYHGTEAVVFFDEEALPKGEGICMERSILEEARGSALGVLVLTDEFFTHTQNTMLELEAFVAGNVHLLPLFLTMSVDEFEEVERWDRWEKKWEVWAAADEKLVIEKWRSYLTLLRTFNGLEFCKVAPDSRQDLFIDEVLKEVARIIGPAVPMSGEDVYGKGRLCRIVDDMYKKCSSKRSSAICPTPTQIASTSVSLGLEEYSGAYAYDLVGIHGFPGLGKSTLCKSLCDFYYGELKGKVCYINLGSWFGSRSSRMQHVLSWLDSGNVAEDIHSLIPLRRRRYRLLKSQLKKQISSMKDPVFLALDNIPAERRSEEEALIYLRCKLPKGSKVLITSTTEMTLRNVTSRLQLSQRYCSFSAVIESMPALEHKEGRDIFEHELNAPAIEKINLHGNVDACVDMCTIFSGRWYHPLMLKSLAASIRYWERKGRLAEALASEVNINKVAAWDRVFHVLDITYGLLSEEAKQVFLDLARCLYNARSSTFSVFENIPYSHEWRAMRCLSHSLRQQYSDRGMEKILLELHDFHFIVKEGRTVNINRLMVEFGKHKEVPRLERFSSIVLKPRAHEVAPPTANNLSLHGCSTVKFFPWELYDTHKIFDSPTCTAPGHSFKTTPEGMFNCQLDSIQLCNSKVKPYLKENRLLSDYGVADEIGGGFRGRCLLQSGIRSDVQPSYGLSQDVTLKESRVRVPVAVTRDHNSQLDGIIVGVQYHPFSCDHGIEFFFSSMEDMAACVGVGLERGKVVLNNDLSVAIQELEVDEWKSEAASWGLLLSDKNAVHLAMASMHATTPAEHVKEQHTLGMAGSMLARLHGVGFDGASQYLDETHDANELNWPLLYDIAMRAISPEDGNDANTGNQEAQSSSHAVSSNGSTIQNLVRLKGKQELQSNGHIEGRDSGDGDGDENNDESSYIAPENDELPEYLKVTVFPLSKDEVVDQQDLPVTPGYGLDGALISPRLRFKFQRHNAKKRIFINAKTSLELDTDSDVQEDADLLGWYHRTIKTSVSCEDGERHPVSGRVAILKQNSSKMCNIDVTRVKHNANTNTKLSAANTRSVGGVLGAQANVPAVANIKMQAESSKAWTDTKEESTGECTEADLETVCNGFLFTNRSRAENPARAKFILNYPLGNKETMWGRRKESLRGTGLFSSITPEFEGTWIPFNDQVASPYLFRIERSLTFHRTIEPSGNYKWDYKQTYVLSFCVNHTFSHLKCYTGKKIILQGENQKVSNVLTCHPSC